MQSWEWNARKMLEVPIDSAIRPEWNQCLVEKTNIGCTTCSIAQADVFTSHYAFKSNTFKNLCNVRRPFKSFNVSRPCSDSYIQWLCRYSSFVYAHLGRRHHKILCKESPSQGWRERRLKSGRNEFLKACKECCGELRVNCFSNTLISAVDHRKNHSVWWLNTMNGASVTRAKGQYCPLLDANSNCPMSFPVLLHLAIKALGNIHFGNWMYCEYCTSYTLSR